ncbi:MAG: MFS transporter, partial [Anaerolineales bacterium]|nr:MFS transporter [Anaerolineales bacterium]
MLAIGRVRQRTRAFIFVAIFVDVLGYGMILPLLPFYAQQFADGALWAGLLRALYAGLQFFTGPLLGALSDRIGRRPVLLLCLLATSVAYLLLGLATSLEWLIVAVTLDGLTGANLIIAQAYLTDRTEPHDRTRAFGLLGAAVGLGAMAGPAFGGLLSVYGLGVSAFVAAAIALGNVLFGLWALPESLPPELRARAAPVATLPFTHLGETLRVARLRELLLSVFALNLVFNGLQAVFPLYTQQRFGWNSFNNGLFFGFLGMCAVVVQGFVVGRLQPRLGDERLTLMGLGLMTATV